MSDTPITDAAVLHYEGADRENSFDYVQPYVAQDLERTAAQWQDIATRLADTGRAMVFPDVSGMEGARKDAFNAALADFDAAKGEIGGQK